MMDLRPESVFSQDHKSPLTLCHSCINTKAFCREIIYIFMFSGLGTKEHVSTKAMQAENRRRIILVTSTEQPDNQCNGSRQNNLAKSNAQYDTMQ